jgi:hypothetical protein
MEMMFQQSPSGEWIPFEIRTRRRYEKGWESNIFRPFPTRESLNAKIQSSYPTWSSHPDLATLVSHLNNTETLVREEIETKPYTKLVPKITGFVDYLPAFADYKIIDELLLSTPFISSMDTEWKRSENGSAAFGAASMSGYHISPEGTLSGLFAVNEQSCNVCHTDTAKHLGILETDITLYGEMWGEDEAFSWHLFQPNSHIYGTWDDVDVSRVVNKTLITAGLLVNSEVRGPELYYKPIKR